MSRIASVFRKAGHRALIPYVTAGYPSIEDTLKVVPVLAESGCDIVELGIPFSDPLADGATIQKASFNALKNGVTPKLCLEVAEKLSRKMDIPLVFMTYFNPIFNFGLDAFCTGCAESGVDGLIVPDLPPDEGRDLEGITRKHDLDLIYLLAPTSSDDRIKLVAERARGFIYLVSVTGVTGARASLPQELNPFVARVRKAAKQPLCVGFGISTPDQARQVATVADGVIVGSRTIQLLETEGLKAVADFVNQLRRALDLAGK
ncbi:MAG TPA: tryptophan synthase subunit alpha [Dehalococcoidia bacterium]